MKKNIIIGIVLVVAIIAVVIGVVFILQPHSDEINNLAENETVQNEIENIAEEPVNTVANETVSPEVASKGKILVTYFSLPENTGKAKEDSTITVDGENLGNTQYVANLIQKQTGADIFRIEAVKQYNVNDHEALIADAQEEQRNNARPEIKNKINNFAEYDTIFIGYPIWWSDLPQILYTFLESYDFTNKNVYLFSTNGGSGLAGTVSTITSKLNTTKVNANAFQLYRNNMEQAPTQVNTWLKELGF